MLRGMHAWISHLAHALPGRAIAQDDIARWIEARLPPGTDGTRLRRFAARSGVETRHAVIDLLGADGDALYPVGRPHGDALERSQAFARLAPPLAVQAVQAACPDGLPAITHLVVATCTGAVAPGLDLLLIDALGLPRSTRRTMIGFMGCYAAMPALRVAWDTVRADPHATVLVVCCELSSLHLHLGPDEDALVAACLFADGASAAVVQAGPDPMGRGLRLVRDACAVVPDTGDQMAWMAAADGFRLRLSPGVPRSLATVLPGLTDELLAGVSRADAHWAVHPGGPRILDDVERGLGLSPEALAASRTALRVAGNRSSGTVLAIIDAMCREPWSGPLVAYAFGPGLTAEGLLLHRHA
jgi:alpha-pyrone synthase